ncbi:MAG: hypothetical protein ACD_79C01522G0005 [uncultured bacterium]|nr:MAG: hypothetical protein ACD_79C01522G0005 [uncultured bacterium]
MKALIVFLMLIFSYCSAVNAHPAHKIEAEIKENAIDIKVLHPVSNPTKHYIDEIVISLNNKVVFTQTFTSQKNNQQLFSFNFEKLNKGDKILINTHCNIFGRKKKEFTVE